MPTLTFAYPLMMLLQTWHIIEEIGGGAYKVAHSLNKYLVAASVLVTVNFAARVFTGIPLAMIGLFVFIQPIRNL